MNKQEQLCVVLFSWGCKADFWEPLLWLAAALPLFSVCAWGPQCNQIPSSHKDPARLNHIFPSDFFLCLSEDVLCLALLKHWRSGG